MPRLRLALSGEPLSGKLTGLGRYTLELCKALRKHDGIAGLQLLSHGKLLGVAESEDLLQHASIGASPPPGWPLRTARAVFEALSGHSLITQGYLRAIDYRARHEIDHDGNIDVLHATNFILPMAGTPAVVTIPDLSTHFHATTHPKSRVSLVNASLRRIVECGSAIIVLCERVRNELCAEFAVDPARVWVTPLAASAVFRPMGADVAAALFTQLGISYRNFFLFAATMEPRKNALRMMQAYLEYLNTEAEEALPLVITGHAGWLNGEVQNLLSAGIDRGKVIAVGHIDDTMLAQLVAGARALVYASVYEGFGLPVLEAMQSGTAAITSKNTPMADFADNAALLVDPHDTESLAEAFLCLGRNAARADRMGDIGSQRAKAYNWTGTAAKTVAVYREVVG